MHIRPPRQVSGKSSLAIGLATLLGSGMASAASTVDDLLELSLEELMQVEVTSVSKKPQRLADAAASVHVITAEDIRLSGANSIPEVLRLAPGMDARRVSGNRWAVSTRGFAELFSSRFLVLVDGRNAFNPAFSGVVWQDFQFPLEDIERIEVIRGPASAVWGTNGMNGVINIITKPANASEGGQAVAGGGDIEGEFGRARWSGGNEAGDLAYRVYVSAQDAGAREAVGAMATDGDDAYTQQSAGFRIDGQVDGDTRWDMSADMFHHRSGVLASMPTVAGPAWPALTERHRGATLRARYEKDLAGGGNLQFQGAYARTDLELPYLLNDRRDTVDFDMQHRFALGRHDLIWGLNYRFSSDTMTGTPVMRMNDPERRLSYYGAFVQGDVDLAENARLALGLRLDHSPLNGWSTQPTARLSWNPHPRHTLWGALSRAERAPSRVDSGMNFNTAYLPGAPPTIPNTLVTIHSTENLDSETLQAGELGLRSQWANGLSSDLVVFTHRYDNLLRSPGTPILDTSAFPLVVAHTPIANGGEMTLNGAELGLDWDINQAWRLRLAQTWNNASADGTTQIDPAIHTPKSISSLRVSWRPSAKVEVDAWLRRTSQRTSSPARPEFARGAVTGLDLRLGWRPRKGLELALVGQNLNDDECDAYAEYAVVLSSPNVVPTCQPRSVFGQVRVDF